MQPESRKIILLREIVDRQIPAKTLQGKVFAALLSHYEASATGFIKAQSLAAKIWEEKTISDSVLPKIDSTISELRIKVEALKVPGLTVQIESSGSRAWRLNLSPCCNAVNIPWQQIVWGISNTQRETKIHLPTGTNHFDKRPQFLVKEKWTPPECLEDYADHKLRLWNDLQKKYPGRIDDLCWHVESHLVWSSHDSTEHVELQLKRARLSDHYATTRVLNENYRATNRKLRQILLENVKLPLPEGRHFLPSANLLAIDVWIVTRDNFLLIRTSEIPEKEASQATGKFYIEPTLFGHVHVLFDVNRFKTWEPSPEQTAFRLGCDLLGMPITEPINWLGCGFGTRLGNVSLFGLCESRLTKAQFEKAFRYRRFRMQSAALEFKDFDPAALFSFTETCPPGALRRHFEASLALALASRYGVSHRKSGFFVRKEELAVNFG